MILPILTKSKEKAREISCKSLLKQYGAATNMYSDDNNDWLVDCRNYLNNGTQFLSYFGNTVLSKNVARCPGDSSTESLNRLKIFEINNGEMVQVSIAPSRANTSDTAAPGSDQSGNPIISILWEKRFFQNLKPSHRGVFFDYQFDPGTQSKNQTPKNNPICEVTGDLTTSFCFRHLGYCNIAYMDGHVGDMTFKDRSILINNGHDFSKEPKIYEDGKEKEWYPSRGDNVQTKYPFGPRPANIRAGRASDKYENTFVVYR